MLNGRYGPYITDKKKNAKIPKDRDPKSITLEEAIAMIAAAPERGGRFGRWGRGKKPAAAGANGAAAAAPKPKGKAKKSAVAEAIAADPERAAKAPAKAAKRPAKPACRRGSGGAPEGARPRACGAQAACESQVRRCQGGSSQAAGAGCGQRPRAAREVGTHAAPAPAGAGGMAP